MNWTPELIEQIKYFAGLGHSASQVATKIGLGASRNAVVGVAHRNSIKFHGIGGGANRKPIAPRKLECKIVLAKAAAPEPPREGMLTLEELLADSCRWPNGDPRQEDFRYCGQKHVEGYSYCPKHCKISFETPEARRAHTIGQAGTDQRPSNQIRHRRTF